MSHKPATWPRTILNSLTVWLAAFVVYMIPSFVVALRMGFELGPKSSDTAAVSRQIGETISGLYRESFWLPVLYAVAVIVLVIWRGIALGRRGATAPMRFCVPAVPLISSAAGALMTDGSAASLVEIPLFIGAGWLGARLLPRPAETPAPDATGKD